MSNQEIDGFKAVIESEPIKNITNPPTKSIGKALGDICDICFGSLGEKAEKSRLKHTKNIEDFKRSLYADIKQIPEENLIEPKLSIIGPALEASKYYYEEEDIKNMFEKLIINSIDSRKISKIHPSFTEIIKQMSPLDAQNLKLFIDSDTYPICNINIKVKDGISPMRDNIFLDNPNCQDLRIQSISISSLNRLELIKIDFTSWFSDDSVYNKFKELPIFESSMQLEKGIVKLTPLGGAFLSVCFSSPLK